MSHPPGPPQPPPYGGGPYPGPGPQQPPWPQQGQWSPAPPPQKPRSGWKWALGGVALLAVIAVTVAVTVSVVGGDSDGDGSPTAAPTVTNGANSDIASANDTGPVAVITEDPTCAMARPILDMRANEQRNGWIDRDPSIPAAAWTPDARAQYESVGESMRTSAYQLVPIAKLTPHRVMRELYEQLIAYSRAYADSIATYAPADDNLALASVSAAAAITNICAAIDYGSAESRGPLVEPLPEPSQVTSVTNPAEAERFLADRNPVCGAWDDAWSQFENDALAWLPTDPDIPASQWSPEQQKINDEIDPVMRRFASQLQALGARSENSTLRDFADLSAQYRRAYVLALSTYTPADKYLANASINAAGLVKTACMSVEG